MPLPLLPSCMLWPPHNHPAFVLSVVHQLKGDTVHYSIEPRACPTWLILDASACRQPMQSLAFAQCIKNKNSATWISRTYIVYVPHTLRRSRVHCAASGCARVTNLLAREPHLSRTNTHAWHTMFANWIIVPKLHAPVHDVRVHDASFYLAHTF